MTKEEILDELMKTFFNDILVWIFIEGTSIFEIDEELAKEITKHYIEKKAQIGI